MSLQIGDEAPNFVADTTLGEINFHEWVENKWTVLMSHPADFTPICTTEIRTLADWSYGDDCVVVPAVPTEDIPEKFPKGHKIIKEYLRTTPQPNFD